MENIDTVINILRYPFCYILFVLASAGFLAMAVYFNLLSPFLHGYASLKGPLEGQRYWFFLRVIVILGIGMVAGWFIVPFGSNVGDVKTFMIVSAVLIAILGFHAPTLRKELAEFVGWPIIRFRIMVAVCLAAGTGAVNWLFYTN